MRARPRGIRSRPRRRRSRGRKRPHPFRDQASAPDPQRIRRQDRRDDRGPPGPDGAQKPPHHLRRDRLHRSRQPGARPEAADPAGDREAAGRLHPGRHRRRRDLQQPRFLQHGGHRHPRDDPGTDRHPERLRIPQAGGPPEAPVRLQRRAVPQGAAFRAPVRQRRREGPEDRRSRRVDAGDRRGRRRKGPLPDRGDEPAPRRQQRGRVRRGEGAPGARGHRHAIPAGRRSRSSAASRGARRSRNRSAR